MLDGDYNEYKSLQWMAIDGISKIFDIKVSWGALHSDKMERTGATDRITSRRCLGTIYVDCLSGRACFAAYRGYCRAAQQTKTR